MATIKKGSYKFIDSPTLTEVTIDIPFTVLPVKSTRGWLYPPPLTRIDVTTSWLQLDMGDGVAFDVFANSDKHSAFQIEGLVPYLNLSWGVGWTNGYASGAMHGISLPSELNIEGIFGRIITVTADTDVDDTSATWFNENTESIGAVTLTYDGKVICAITSGQTATVKCKGKVMKDDIVITL